MKVYVVLWHWEECCEEPYLLEDFDGVYSTLELAINHCKVDIRKNGDYVDWWRVILEVNVDLSTINKKIIGIYSYNGKQLDKEPYSWNY